MDQDGLNRKVSRRTVLRAGLGGLGAVALAACGSPGATTPSAPATTGAGTTAASAPETAVPAATTAVEATTAAAAPATAMATTAPGVTASAAATAAVAPAPAATAAPIVGGAAGKISILHRTEYFQGLQDKFRQVVVDFVKSQGAALEISTVNPEAFGDFTAKVQASVQAGNPPDLAYHTISVQQLRFLDTVQDVSDVVDQAVKMYGAIVPINADKSAKIEGKWWSVPFQSNSGAWFARKDAFDAAGADVSTLDTYDKRRDAALKVSQTNKDIYGWGMTINKSGDGHGTIMGVIQAFGGSITDKSGKKVTWNSPETVAAVKWLQETYTSPKYKPMLPPGIESWTDPSNNENYLAGKIALTSNAFSIYAKMKKDNSPYLAKTAVLRAPKSNKGEVLEAGGNGWFSIFKGAKNVDLAKKVILNVLDPKVFTPMVQEGGGLFLPAFKNLWTDDILKIDPNFATLKEIIFNPTPYTGFAWPADPNAAIDAVTAQAVQSEMMANVTSGKMTPEQAVADAHKKIVSIFEELGLPQS